MGTMDNRARNAEAYRAARDVLLRHRDDINAARTEFQWPVLDRFNWVLDWFDVVAEGNDLGALTVVAPHAVRTSTYAQLAEQSKRVARWLAEQGVSPGDVVLLVCGTRTSGTTSAPKLIAHSHVSWPVGHLSSFYWNGLRPGDIHCNLAAPGWAKHAWSSLFVPFTAEATVLAFEESAGAPEFILDRLRASGVSSLCAPPTTWRRLVRAGLGRPPSELRDATSVGERLPGELADAVRAAWSVEIRDGYGQTEATGLIGTPPGARTADGALGHPLPGYDIVLVDPVSGRIGDDGEICVDVKGQPPGLRPWMAGPDGLYHTGDLAEALADGRIRCLGRTDDVFKSFDRRIAPQELEDVTCMHPLVHDSAVVPIPHPVGDWEPKAYIEVVAGASADVDLAREIFQLVAEQLPEEKTLAAVEFVDALPRTQSGKIQRKRLRQLPAEHGYRARDVAPARQC
jgi:acetyl-CoA synthetase